MSKSPDGLAHREASLEIDTRPLQSDIGDEKLAGPNFGDNFVADFLVVVDTVNSHRVHFTVYFHCGFNPLRERIVQRVVKGHRNKAATGNSADAGRLNYLPAFGG